MVRSCRNAFHIALALLLCVPTASRANDASVSATADATARAAVLVYTRTTGYRHDVIPKAIATLRTLAKTQGVRVESSEDPTLFTAARLARYRAVVFANTTGDVLDASQRAAFEAYVAGGGGFMGLHSAADTEYGWPWYGRLVGARFVHHPPGLQTARVTFTSGETWRVRDEFYDYDRTPRGAVRVLATLDERDYAGGRMGDDHPIAWCHASLGGRAWYTGLGHDAALYDAARFRLHLTRGLRYVLGTSDSCES